jgi:hypothetical protein
LAAAKIARLRALEADPAAAESNGPLDLTEEIGDAAGGQPIPSIPTP